VHEPPRWCLGAAAPVSLCRSVGVSWWSLRNRRPVVGIVRVAHPGHVAALPVYRPGARQLRRRRVRHMVQPAEPTLGLRWHIAPCPRVSYQGLAQHVSADSVPARIAARTCVQLTHSLTRRELRCSSTTRGVCANLNLAGVVCVAREPHGDLAVDDETLAQVRCVRLHALVITAHRQHYFSLHAPT